jgi:hypothetical protein
VLAERDAAPAAAIPFRPPPPGTSPLPGQPVVGTSTSESRPPPALAGGTLAITRDGRLAVVSDPDGDRIVLVDLGREAVAATVPLQPGDEPGRIAEDDAGRVHVALRRGGALVTVDPRMPEAPLRRPVCPAPRGVAYDRAKDVVHVACAGGELVSLPAAGGTATRWLRLDPDLRDVIVDGDRLLVSRFRSAELLVVDAEGRITQRQPPPVALNLFRRESVAAPARTRFTPSVAWRAIPRPGGGGALVLHQRGFAGEVGTQPTPKSTSAYGGSSRLCDGIVQAVLSNVAPGTRAKPAPAINGTVLAIDIALAPDQIKVAILAVGNAQQRGQGSAILAGSLRSFARQEPSPDCVTTLFAGPIPSLPMTDKEVLEDVWFPPGDAGILGGLVRAEGVALAWTPAGEVVVQTRAPATLRIPARKKVIDLGGDTVADAGYSLFHSNAGAGIACASCHPEGGEDGRVWSFAGEGRRRTQSLRGGIAATLPLHWDGTLKDFEALTLEVFTNRMGGPRLSPAQVAAVSRFIDGLPAPPPVRDPGDAAAARGRALFNDPALACSSCHAGPHLTDNQSRDVGTGGLFQTPSLVGVGWRAPFMHDGCAATLAGRFARGCGGDERHGAVARLSSGELVDLVAYLESL